MKLLLANKYSEKRVTYPVWVQPKLNGIRARFTKGKFWSRDNKKFSPSVVAHLLKHFPSDTGDTTIDGEFYKHGWPLQRINSAISVVRQEPNEDSSSIEFHAFDIAHETASFAERYDVLIRLLAIINNNIPQSTPINLVPAWRLDNKEEVDSLYESFLEEGYEGMMYRLGWCKYFNSTANNRSWQLLKRKDFLDEECEILGVYEGKYTDKGSRLVNSLGGVTCLFEKTGKEFSVGSGFSDKERDKYWAMPSLIIGQKLHVRYECLSEDGVPLKPTVGDKGIII